MPARRRRAGLGCRIDRRHLTWPVAVQGLPVSRPPRPPSAVTLRPTRRAGTASPVAAAQGDATATTVARRGLAPIRTSPVTSRPPATVGCKLDKRELRQGDSGNAVTCLQQALIAAGISQRAPTGTFDGDTFAAVNKLQKERTSSSMAWSVARPHWRSMCGRMRRRSWFTRRHRPQVPSICSAIHFLSSPPVGPMHLRCPRIRAVVNESSTTGQDARVSGDRQERSRDPFVAGFRQQVQQRDPRHPRGVQP